MSSATPPQPEEVLEEQSAVMFFDAHAFEHADLVYSNILGLAGAGKLQLAAESRYLPNRYNIKELPKASGDVKSNKWMMNTRVEDPENEAEGDIEDAHECGGAQMVPKAAGTSQREPRFDRRDSDERRDARCSCSTSEPPAQHSTSCIPPRSRSAARPASISRTEMPGRSLASPSPSAASDKENRDASRRVSGQKRAATITPNDEAGKRRRTGLMDRDVPEPSQVARKRARQKVTDTRFYDPDQPKEERREVRRQLRDQARYVTDSRNELMDLSTGELRDKFKNSNVTFKDVKQTDDATIDSRNIVNMGDTAFRAVKANSGGSEMGISIDELIGRAVSFMRRGPSEADATRLYPPKSTQRLGHQRPRRTGAESDNSDDEEDDEGDAMNWEWMGRKAAIPNNLRPPVPVFLLGPLSMQKKVRKVTQRVARQRLNPADALRPDELKIGEIQRNDNADLVGLCRQIHELLEETNEQSAAAAEAEIGGNDEPTDEEVERVLWKYGMGDDGGTLLTRFAFNPKSFGQTVENLFYLSFLIKENKIGLGIDTRGLQTLHKVDAEARTQGGEGGGKKHQGVFHIDYDVWEGVVEAFGIIESTIPHRHAVSTQLNEKGWYG